MKKIFMAMGLFLITAACTLLIPPDTDLPVATTSVHAAVSLTSEGTCGDTATYTYADGVLTISGSGAIEDRAFKELTQIHSVIINSGITEIGAEAFKECTNLTQVTIPDSVTEIRSGAFASSGLKSLTLPKTLTKLGACILEENTGVKEITVPKTIITMDANYGGGHGAFYDSAIETITFENGLTALPKMACHGAKQLKTVNLPDSVTTIGAEAFKECSGLTEITIPESVTEIESGAFASSGLKSLTFPKTLTKLGACILEENTGVKEVTVPKTIITMDANYGGGHGAFYDSAIEKITFENGLTALPEMACHGAKQLKTVNLPESVTTIGAEAFKECSGLTEITIPESVTTIESGAFAESGLKSLTFPKALTKLGACILVENTGVKEMIVPKTITSMEANYGGGHGAFYGSAIETVTFEDGLTTIPVMACHGAAHLTKVNIPESVTTIENGAFAESGLTSLTLPKELITLGACILEKNTGVKEVTVPKTITSMDANYGGGHGAFYDSAIETITFENGLTALPKMACHGAKQLKTVNLPDSVTTIGAEAFKECSSLSGITIPDSVTTIESGAFAVSGLMSLTFPKDLTTLGACILEENTGVKEVAVPKTIISMDANYGGGHGAFYNSAIEKITFENGLTELPKMACHGAKLLTSMSLPESVTTIGAEAFKECSSLLEITIPDSVTTIESGAFAESGLVKLLLPPNLTKLGACILVENTGVKEVTVPKTIITMEANYGGGHGAFFGSAVESITFEDGLKIVPAMACHGMDKVTTVMLPVSVNKFEKDVFAETGSGIVVYAYTGSYAMTYAQESGLRTESIGQCIASTITASNVTKVASKKDIVFSLNAKTTGKGTLSYQSNNSSVTVNAAGKVTIAKNFVGTAKITITVNSVAEYLEASKVVTVTVKPASVKLKKLEKSKKKYDGKLTVTWEKNTNSTGFEVQYATNKAFTKDLKKANVKGSSKTSTILKSLKKNKTYYVRVRTYKNTTSGKIVSDWSNVKNIKM